MAASAPIWQFPDIYDCHGYFKIVTDDLRGYSEECAQTVNNSWSAVDRIAATPDGRKWLQDTFQICEDLSSDQAIKDFLTWLSGTYESLAMTDYPNPASFLEPLPAYPMKEVCKLMTNPQLPDKELLQEVFVAISVFYNYTGQTKCNSIGLGEMGTGWDYQFCTEVEFIEREKLLTISFHCKMVMPVCSNGKDDVFPVNPWNLSNVAKDCYRKWNVYPEAFKAVTLFGGKNISTLSNVIFSNGDRDP